MARAIDSSSKAFRAWQDSFNQVQDSIYRSSVKVDVAENNRNLDYFLAEQKRREQKERQQVTFRLILAGVILAIIIVLVVRRKKHQS